MNAQMKAADTTELLAKYADELAAMVEAMLNAGRVSAPRLREVRDSLGEIYVELDQVTTELRQNVRAEVATGVREISEKVAYARLVGTAA